MKLFQFWQNNSGGTFDKDEWVDQWVWIEASNAAEANTIAKRIGIYFDGCEQEIDCPCCGDRWHPVWDGDEMEVPDIREFRDIHVEVYGREPDDTIIHLLNGEIHKI